MGETILWVLGILCTVAGFWFVDWKSRVEKAHDEHAMRVRADLENHIKEIETCKTILRERLHNCELQLAERVTRDELKELRDDWKTDLTEFKREIKEIIAG